MASTVRHVGLRDPLVGFPVLERRSLAVNTANRQIAVGDEAPGAATGLPLSLIGIRYFATTAQYLADDFVVHLGQIWKAKFTIAPGSPFSPSDWVGMTDGGQFLLLDGSREMYGNLEIDKPGASLVLNALGASQADIWFRRDSLTRWMLRSDETAAVDFYIGRFDDAGFIIDKPLFINRSTGRISILGNPVGALELVPKQYADALHTISITNANDRVFRSGDTMTGPLVVPALTIKNPSYADLYFAAAGPARWLIRGADGTTANLEFHHYNASGDYLGAALVLDNVSGLASFQNYVRVAGGLQFGGAASSGFYGDGTNIAIRTHGSGGIYFQTANGGANYALMHPGGLDVYGIITSTAQDGLRVTVPAGYFARTLYTVSGVRQWSAGVYADGRYAIGDESAGAARLVIDLNGNVWIGNKLDVGGAFTAGSIYSPTIQTGTLTADVVNTGTLNVSGNGNINGNLTVNGTITSSGTTPDGTPIPTSASGYQTRSGTPGPFLTNPMNAPWNYSGPKYFNISDSPAPYGGYWGLWVDHIPAGAFAWMGTLFADFSHADPWEAVKAADPVDYDDPSKRDGVARKPLMSDKTIAVLMKALQQAMERIETLEARLDAAGIEI